VWRVASKRGILRALANALATFFNVALQVVQITRRRPNFKLILKLIFKLLSYLPVAVLHGLGAVLGLMVLALSSIYRERLTANMRTACKADSVRLSDLTGWQAIVGAACQAGMMVAELPRLWLGRAVTVQWHARPALDAAFTKAASNNKGIIFLTPHLGSWEVAGQAIASACNAHGKVMTVMYKPAKQGALDDIVKASRKRPGMETVPADGSGVRQTLRALKGGGAIGLLPDQVPLEGMGVWSNVFGKPAYTMTLAAKLAQSNQCPVVMVWCERLSLGRGYRVFTQTLELNLQATLDAVVQQINDAVEAAISKLPTQYLWGYARYKAPKPAVTATTA
jgi:Kdo2-lipid IVA lauroyltransferase/acyltransferase